MRYQHFILLFLSVLFKVGQLIAQELVNPYWDMQTQGASYTPTSNCAVSVLSPGNNYGNTVFLSEASSSVGYAGASGYFNASLAARSGPLQKESLGSAFVEFSITPAPGFRFIVKAISFGVRSTQTGPKQWALFQQEDQYAASLAQGPLSNNSTWALMTVSGINFSTTKAVNFRIYGFDGEGNPAINVANWRLDDLMLQLQLVPDNLPVKWLYQRVETAPGKVMVEWATKEEVGVESFMVQRSVDALRFETIAEILPQSNGSSIIENLFYKYADSLPLPGRSFYRVIQKDISGSVEVGNILFIERQMQEQKFRKGSLVYSPLTGKIKLPIEYSGPVNLQLYTLNGQRVGGGLLNAYEGLLQLTAPIGAKGYVVLVLTIAGNTSRSNSYSTTAYIN